MGRLFALCLLLGSCVSADLFEERRTWPRPTRGVVVTEHPEASAVGLQVLEAGGNAADAAIAAALVLAVVYPQAGNLGGGGFALWVPHEGAATSLDFRETTPAEYEPELYLDEQGAVVASRSRVTPLAVGVPGTPAGLAELFHRHGSKRISFARLCQPAIERATRGVKVDAWLARDLRRPDLRAKLEADPGARAVFYPNGEPLAEGELLRQPALAATLTRYSKQGPEGFYRGSVADAIVRALEDADRRAGNPAGASLLSLDDLASYRVVKREPIRAWFRGWEVVSMGPPSSGGVALLQTLGMLDGLPLDADRDATLEERELGLDSASDTAGISARAVHWWIEAMRRAFADRAEHLGDPDFHAVPMRKLLSTEWIARRRVSIGERADPGVAPLQLKSEADETTHLSVIDRTGNAVSLTTTINAAFGSGILVPEAGFLLNNEVDDFSILAGTPNMFGLVGGEANQLRPRKRPLSSMTPTVVRGDGGRVVMVIGSPGGPRIITAVIQVILRVFLYGQDLEAAIRAPRLHQQWSPPETRFETGWNPGLLETLARRHGQPLATPEEVGFGSVQAILVDRDGEPTAFSDPRRGGVAAIEGLSRATPARPGDPVRPIGPMEDAARQLAPR